jgi:hypothetical protein
MEALGMMLYIAGRLLAARPVKLLVGLAMPRRYR